MDNKLLNFHLFRYHLLPIDNENKQFDIFNNEPMTLAEIKNRKNEFFKQVLHHLKESKSNTHPLKVEHAEDNYYLFKIAQKKTTTITQNFENLQLQNEPYAFVLINNDPSVQKIAISDNYEAFSSPEVVKNILKKVFRKDLEKFGLNVEIEQLFDSVDFWKYVRDHEGEVSYINFQYIKPNLANISNSLPEAFKAFANETNSHESHLTIKAPQRGSLEKISQRNENIAGLVDYTSQGAGSIKLKIKGLRKQINTKESPIIIQMREIDIEGTEDQVIKLYQKIIE